MRRIVLGLTITTIQELPPQRPAHRDLGSLCRGHQQRLRPLVLWSYVPLIKCPSLVVHGADGIPQSLESLEGCQAPSWASRSILASARRSTLELANVGTSDASRTRITRGTL